MILSCKGIFVSMLGLLSLTHAVALRSQQPLPLKPWDRVRVSIPSIGPQNYTGDVAAVSADSLVLRLGPVGKKFTMSVPLSAVAKLEVSRGGAKRLVLPGAVIGGVAGAAYGLAQPQTDDPPCSGFLDFNCNPRSAGTKRLIATVGGALLGSGLGILVGLIIPTERWETIPLEQRDRSKVTVVPLSGGRLGLAASLPI